MSKYLSVERVREYRALKKKRNISSETESNSELENTRMYIINIE